MNDNTETLPPLPEPRVFTAASDRLLFTADQMRDYARAALAQAEPVAYVDHADGRVIWKGKRLPGGALLYAAQAEPSQQEGK